MVRSATCDVVIVGAGLAGAVAARELSHRGLDVVAIEGREYAGGRVLTEKRWGRDLELGGQAISALQPYVWAEATRYGLPLIDRPKVDVTYVSHGSTIDVMSPEDFGALAQQVTGRLVSPAVTVFPRPYEPLSSPTAIEMDGLDLGTVVKNLGLDPREEAVLDGLLTVNFNTPYHVGAYTQSLRRAALVFGHTDLLTEVVRWRIAGGFHRLVDAILTDARCRVEFGEAVTAVESTDDGVVAHASGLSVTARAAIVTVPLNVMSTIQFDPPLAPGVAKVAHEGQLTRGIMGWVRLRGISESFSAIAPHDRRLTFIRADGTTDGDIIAQCFGPDSTRLDMNDVPSVASAVAELVPGAEVVDSVGHDWGADPFARGGWAMLAPGQLTDLHGGSPRTGDRVRVAGSDVARGWAGYFDGAVESAIEVARDVRLLLG